MITIPPDIERAVLPALERFPRQKFHHCPYGIIWYLINKPIAILSLGYPQGYMFWTGLFSIALVIYLTQFQSPLFLLVFSGVTVFHLVKATWNVSILWLCLLGLIHPFLLAVPILAKLPVGNPAPFRKTWNMVIHAIPYRMNWFYYLTIGIVWLTVAFKV